MMESNGRMQHRLAPAGMSPGNGDSHAVVTPVGWSRSPGRVVMDERGELVGADDPRTQAEQVFENLRLVVSV